MPIPAHMLLMAGGEATQSLSAAILALSPLGYWKLDESSGTTATDSSGNSRNGTYTGSGYTLQGATGGDGVNYADFGNGASSHVAIADNNVWSVDNASGLTVFLLIKADSVAASGQRHPISKGAASNYEWAYVVNATRSGWLGGRVWDPAGIGQTASHIDTLTTSWNAVAMTLSTSTDPLIYRNSSTATSSVVSPEDDSPGTTYTNGTAPVWIGWRADSAANQYHQGGLAHVAIFAGNLNSTQIGTMMTAADAEGWY
jgi:hypothetical protein